MKQNPYIRIDNVSKRYVEGGQQRIVLLEASAEFEKGEFAAILGKSGSGKSTLLNLISGIDLSDSGQVWLNGLNLTELNDKNRTLFRRKNIGFIFQFFNLIPTMTILENITLPAELNGIQRGEAIKHAKYLLEEVGLSDRLNTFPDRLSGGEQQRVAIARALVNDPILLLADEPTGNLDEHTGNNILALLDRLTRQEGKNMIMVTHNREAASFADRIVYLKEGKLCSQNNEEETS